LTGSGGACHRPSNGYWPVEASEPEAEECCSHDRFRATDAEIGEVVGHLALNVLTNYFNILAEVENDWPVVTLRPAATSGRKNDDRPGA
jgi:hypothetical protein